MSGVPFFWNMTAAPQAGQGTVVTMTQLRQRRCTKHSLRMYTSGAQRKSSTSFYGRCTSTIADAPPRQTGGVIAVRSTSVDVES